MILDYNTGTVDLAKLFEKSEELLCNIDKEGRLTHHTKLWETVSGLDALSFERRDFSSLLYSEKDRTEFSELFKQALSGQIITEAQLRFKKGDTAYHWIRVTLLGNNGQSALIIGKIISGDLLASQQDKLVESEERYNMALQGIAAGVFDMFDIENELVYVSPVFMEMLGRPHQDRPYTTPERNSWVAPHHLDKVLNAFYAHLETGVPFNCEAQFSMGDGRLRWFLLNGKSKRDDTGKVVRLVGSLIDIEDRKAAEEEVLKAKEMAEEVSKLKSNFLSNMSHEIRTPLNGIIGLGNLIAKEKDVLKIRELVELQKQSSKRLLYTLTSILSFAKLETELEYNKLKKVNISQTVKKAYDSLLELGQSKNLNLKLVSNLDNLTSLGNENQYYQVFHNLIHNAIKFTTQGNVTVEVGKTGMPGNYRIFVKVTDTGIGITNDFMDKVFEPFAQESMGESRSFEGSGISLAFSKRYVELLGGAIHVQSRKDRGSTFEILIPCVA